MGLNNQIKLFLELGIHAQFHWLCCDTDKEAQWPRESDFWVGIKGEAPISIKSVREKCAELFILHSSANAEEK